MLTWGQHLLGKTEALNFVKIWPSLMGRHVKCCCTGYGTALGVEGFIKGQPLLTNLHLHHILGGLKFPTHFFKMFGGVGIKTDLDHSVDDHIGGCLGTLGGTAIASHLAEQLIEWNGRIGHPNHPNNHEA